MGQVAYDDSNLHACYDSTDKLCYCDVLLDTAFCPACYWAGFDAPYHYQTFTLSGYTLTGGAGCFSPTTLGNYSVTLQSAGFYTDGSKDECYWKAASPLSISVVKSGVTYDKLQGRIILQKYRANSYFTVTLLADLLSSASSCSAHSLGSYTYTFSDTVCMEAGSGTAASGSGCITTYGTLGMTVGASNYPEWSLCNTYSSPTIVRNIGNQYQCKSTHTASSATEPGVGASWTTYWDLVV